MTTDLPERLRALAEWLDQVEPEMTSGTDTLGELCRKSAKQLAEAAAREAVLRKAIETEIADLESIFSATEDMDVAVSMQMMQAALRQALTRMESANG